MSVAPSNTWSPPPFNSGRFRAAATKACLGLAIVFSVAESWAAYLQIELVRTALAGHGVSEGELGANEWRFKILDSLGRVVFFVTGIVFCSWLHNALRNLPALGRRDMKYAPMWAWVGFVIPFLNLVRPYQVVRDVWEKSGPHSEAAHLQYEPPLILWWWLSFVAAKLTASVVGMWARGADTPAGLINVSWFLMGSEAVTVMAAILAVIVVTEIERRQAAFHERLSQERAQEWFRAARDELAPGVLIDPSKHPDPAVTAPLQDELPESGPASRGLRGARLWRSLRSLVGIRRLRGR